MGPRKSKIAPRWPKMASSWPKMAPRSLKVAHRWPKIAPRWPKMPQDAAETGLRRPRGPQDDPNFIRLHTLTAHRPLGPAWGPLGGNVRKPLFFLGSCPLPRASAEAAPPGSRTGFPLKLPFPLRSTSSLPKLSASQAFGLCFASRHPPRL